MPSFRATVRWLSDGQRYHVEDIEAGDLAEALERLRAAMPADVAARADLVEIRRQTRAEEREYGPE